MLPIHPVHFYNVRTAYHACDGRWPERPTRRCVLYRRAADIAKEGNRNSVTGNDIVSALRDLEFDDLMPSVESALAAFREAEKARSIEAAAKRAANQARNSEQTAETVKDEEANDDADGRT